MKTLQTTIRFIFWTSIFLAAVLITDWLGREIILNLPW